MSAQATSVGCLSDSEAALCPDHRECAITNLPTLLSDGVSYTCSAPAGLQCDSTRWRKVAPSLSGNQCKAACNADLYGPNDSSLLGMAAMACPKDQFEAICKKVNGGSCSEKILGSEYWDRGAQEADEVGDSIADAAADLADGIGAFHHRMWENNRGLTSFMDLGVAGGLYRLKIHQLPVDVLKTTWKIGKGGHRAFTGESGLDLNASRIDRVRAAGQRFGQVFQEENTAEAGRQDDDRALSRFVSSPTLDAAVLDAGARRLSISGDSSAYSTITAADTDFPGPQGQRRGSGEGLLGGALFRSSRRDSTGSELLFEQSHATPPPHRSQRETPHELGPRNTFI